MYIDRLLYPIESLGPGRRAVLWTQGCSHQCKCCIAPELWETKPSNRVDARAFANTVTQQFANKSVDGLTITGGDPMEQFDELMAFLEDVRSWVPDILVYTGYTLAQLERRVGYEPLQRAKALIDVLIDGPYIHEQNDNHVALRGSTNQVIHYWNPLAKERYEGYMANHGRTIQNVFLGDSVFSVGIHNREGGCVHGTEMDEGT